MRFKNIILDRQDRIAVLTINRPKVKNAIDVATMEEMEHVLSSLETDSSVLALIVTGNGEEAFISGGDLRYFQSLDDIYKGRAMSLKMQNILSRLEGLDIPVIAALNGYAYGGGWEVAVSCDMRIAVEYAKIGFKQVNFGLTTGWGGTTRLVRTVGRSIALKLLMTGAEITATEAHKIGLVDTVVKKGRLKREALELARCIVSQPPLSIRFIKRAVHKGRNMSEAEGMDYEAELFSILWGSRDHNEAVEAFFEKRVPKWKGR